MSDNIVYGLFDPNTKELRYIGYTSDQKKRYYDHHNIKKLKTNNHKNNWIKSLLSKNQKAEMYVLEYCENTNDLPIIETELIEYYKFIGCNLTNSTVGGDGIKNGYKRPKEFGKKLSIAKKGIPMPPRTIEHCQNLSLSKKGKKFVNIGQFKNKLTFEEIKNIKLQYEFSDCSKLDLSKKYIVAQATIRKITQNIILTNEVKELKQKRWAKNQSISQRKKQNVLS